MNQEITMLRSQYDTLMLVYRKLLAVRDVCNPERMYEMAIAALEAAAELMAYLQKLMEGSRGRFKGFLTDLVKRAKRLLEDWCP